MKPSIRIKKVPIWREKVKEEEGYLEKFFKGFDPTKMPEPENECDMKRQRVRVVRL